jgi:broad specificity phosphatase PhoE
MRQQTGLCAEPVTFAAMPVIHLIRHAQASFGGDSYDVLSEIGERQAELVDAALKARGVEASRVAAGTLRRQIDTARVSPELDERWNEYDTAAVLAAHGPDLGAQRTEMGAVPGMTSREFQQVLDSALLAWIEAGEDSPCSETWPAFQARSLGALADLAASLGSGEQALVFTSGGPIAAICASLIGAPDSSVVTLNRVCVNSAVTKLMSGRGGVRLVTFNDHGHLEHERELMTFR